MHAPVADIEAVRQGTRKVLRTVADLTDEQAAAQSRLPGWTRAEVLTHLAPRPSGQERSLGGLHVGEITDRGEQLPCALANSFDLGGGHGHARQCITIPKSRACLTALTH